MVLKIRLARWGLRNNPFYGIVVMEARKARDAQPLEELGTYNPIPDAQKVKQVQLNISRIKYWLGVGAHVSDRVGWILAKANLLPVSALQLQKTGVLSLSDKTTWNIEITDENGTKKIVTQEEARELLPPGEQSLLPKPAIDPSELWIPIKQDIDKFMDLVTSENSEPLQPLSLSDEKKLQLLRLVSRIRD